MNDHRDWNNNIKFYLEKYNTLNEYQTETKTESKYLLSVFMFGTPVKYMDFMPEVSVIFDVVQQGISKIQKLVKKLCVFIPFNLSNYFETL